MRVPFRVAFLVGACVASIVSLVVPPWRLQVTVSQVRRGHVVRSGEERTELAPLWRPPLYRRDLVPGADGTEVKTSERRIDHARRFLWWSWLAIAVVYACRGRVASAIVARRLEAVYLLVVLAVGLGADRAFLILRPQLESWQLDRHLRLMDEARTDRTPAP